MLVYNDFDKYRRTIDYVLSSSCANCYRYDNNTGVSSIDIGMNYTIEFKIGSNILYIDNSNLDNKEFIDLLKMSNRAVICKSDKDLFNPPRGVILLHETDSEEDGVSNVTDLVIGSQAILIVIVNDSNDKYKSYIDFEYEHGHYTSRVK